MTYRVCVFCFLQSETVTIICGWNVCICCNLVGMKGWLHHTVYWTSLSDKHYSLQIYTANGTHKSRIHPRTAHEGLAAERRYSFIISLTSALDGRWLVNATPRRLYPPGNTRYSLYRRLGGPRDRYGRVRKISPPTCIRSRDRSASNESLQRLS